MKSKIKIFIILFTLLLSIQIVNAASVSNETVRYVNSWWYNINTVNFNRLSRTWNSNVGNNYDGVDDDWKRLVDRNITLETTGADNKTAGWQNKDFGGTRSANGSTFCAIQGIVQDNIGADGSLLLKKAYTFPSGALAGKQLSLVPSSQVANANTNIYTTRYENYKFPFYLNSSGYYEFDSRTHTVRADTANKKFTLYTGTNNGFAGFFPFNTPEQNLAVESNRIYNFGGKIEIPFYLSDTGRINNQDIVFNFSGDDDIWVYVDGKLALDIGGKHGRVEGKINFNTQIATVQNAAEAYSSYNEALAAKQAKGKIGPDSEYSYENIWYIYGPDTERINVKKGAPHTLTIFYTERATGESNFYATFNLIPAGLNVRYVDKYTGADIATNVETIGEIGKVVNSSAKQISGYTLIQSPSTNSHTLKEGGETVIYYYAKNVNLTTKYIDEITKKEFTSYNEGPRTLKQGDSYTTTKKAIPGYTFTKTNGVATSGTMGNTNVEVIYYYKKNTSATVKHVDKYDNSIVLDTTTKQGLEGDAYSFSSGTFNGYVYENSQPKTVSGNMPASPVTVVFYYIKQSNVIVKYIDENTGEEIPGVDTITTRYKQKDSYTTTKKDIPKYRFTRDTGNTSGIVENSDIEVIYYYKKISAGVDSIYIDQITGEEIESREHIDGLENDEYVTNAKEIPGYYLVFTPTNSMGKMTVEKITVTFEYRKGAKVTTEHIDENTGEKIADDDVKVYKEGDNYSTQEKIIRYYTLTGTSDNTEGIIGRENIKVTYRYKKVAAGVEIRYIDQVTQEKIAESVIKIGVEKDPYTSEAKEIEGYELVVNPENANGEMTVDKIIVTYEYRKNANVITRYIDENNGNVLLDEKIDKYKEGDEYSTIQEDIDGYTYTRVQGDANGTIGRSDIYVTYYYKKNTSVTAKYIDMITNEEIADREEILGLENDDYTTNKKDITGYIYEEVTGASNGKMRAEPIEVVYKYKKAANLITIHVDENTGEKIADNVVKTYKEGDEYEALAQNIEGYILVREPDEKVGVMGREDVEKTFYYKKISGGLIVKYVDKITGEQLDYEEYYGKEGDIITLDEKEIEGYVLVEKPDVTEEALTPDPKEVIYYYKKIVKIDIIGIDQETREELYTDSMTGIEGDEYKTTPRELENYKLVTIPENREGIYTRYKTVVIYEYRRATGKVIVKYIDKETNEELDSFEITGRQGDNYQTEQKEFKDYNFIEIVGEDVGIISGETKEVIYYYEKKTGKLIVRYIDLDENELDREESENKVGESFKVEEKEFEGYEVIERPDSLEGEYVEGITELIFILSKIEVKPEEKGTIIVKFIDKDGNELKESIITEEAVEQDYYFEAPEIPGYRIVSDREIITKYEKGEKIFEIIYEKIVDIISPNTGDIAVGLFTVLALISIGGIVYVVVRNRNNKENKK